VTPTNKKVDRKAASDTETEQTLEIGSLDVNGRIERTGYCARH
jgi:hypothetical protein